MHAFWQTVHSSFYPDSSMLFSSCFFNNFHCLWFPWISFTMIRLNIPFLHLSCWVFVCGSWICFHVFHWGLFWHYLLWLFKILPLDHSFFSFKYLNYMHVTLFEIAPQFLGAWSIFFFYLLFLVCISVWECLSIYIQVNWF